MTHGPFALRALIAGTFAALPLLTAASALAQSDFPDNDWRRGTRRRESPQAWAFELRFGPYRPRVDEEFKNGATPYKQVFGDSARLAIGVELDWQALRIPYVGTFGPGLGWSYTRMSAPAKLTGTTEDSAETTSLWIMPMYAVGVLRADVFPREMSIPLVPYAKLGMGYAFWRSSNELGASVQNGVAGKGHSYGFHLAGGIALQLDFLDAASTQQLDNSVGINHSYAYFEWVYSDLGALTSDQMHVGTSSWVTGLALEM